MEVHRRPLRLDRPPRTKHERWMHAFQRAWLHTYKRKLGCKSCRVKEGLTFHHRDPAKKRFNIGDGRFRSWSALHRELEKCDILCKACHRVAHGH